MDAIKLLGCAALLSILTGCLFMCPANGQLVGCFWPQQYVIYDTSKSDQSSEQDQTQDKKTNDNTMVW